MRVVFHLSGFYDWEPVPDDAAVTPADVAAGKVRPSANGGYLMRVQKNGDTHTDVMIAENQIIQTIIFAYTNKNKQGSIITRQEAIAEHLASYVMPHHANRKWMKHVEVEDSGPDAKLFDDLIAPHLAAQHGRAPGANIEAEDLPALKAAYVMEKSNADHVAHLHKHFKIVPKVEAPPVEAPKGADQ